MENGFCLMGKRRHHEERIGGGGQGQFGAFLSNPGKRRTRGSLPCSPRHASQDFPWTFLFFCGPISLRGDTALVVARRAAEGGKSCQGYRLSATAFAAATFCVSAQPAYSAWA